MGNKVVYTLVLALFAGVSLAESISPDDSLNCTINNEQLISIRNGDAFIVDTVIYDYMENYKLVYFTKGVHLKSLAVKPNKYVSIVTWGTYFQVEPLDETKELSHPSEHFYYNFTLTFTCGGTEYEVESLIPIHETNTYTPVFSNDVYEYALFSPYVEDLQRLIELNPLVANDNDVSSTEVIFSIESNDYFDIQYEGIVPGSLNKNHTAKLISKKSSIEVARDLELTIYVTDLGYPPRSSNATIILKPLKVKYPTFKEAYYIGDYYVNNTFVMRSQPELEMAGVYHEMEASFDGPLYYDYFSKRIFENGTVAIGKINNLPELAIYKYSYLIYTLQITYTDTAFNDYITKGNATILVELHDS